MPTELIPLKEFMAETGLSRSTIYRRVQEGLPHRLYGERAYWFPMPTAADWLDERARTKRNKRRQTVGGQ